MSKVVFFGMPAYGHTNPTLAVVKELTERGVQVIYYNTERFRESLEKVGADFRLYRDDDLEDLASMSLKSKDMYKLFAGFIDIGRHIIEEHLEEVRAENPDCIVFDSHSSPGAAIAHRLNIPAVSSCTTFATNDAINLEMIKAASFGEKINFARLLLFLAIPRKEYAESLEVMLCGTSKRAIDYTKFINSVAKQTIVYTSKSFQPKDELFDDSYYYVGPSIVDREEHFELPHDESFQLSFDERPLIYISIGTVMYNLDFFKTAFRAFGDGKYRVLLSIGKGVSVEDLNIPDNFIVKNYVPQLEVLKEASLFVSHCGMNSAHESLYHGVPIVGLPQVAEQALVALSVEREGAGIYLRRMSAKKLRAAAEKILSDNSYRENCLRLQKGFKEAGGAARAADLILEVAGVRGKVVKLR